MTIFNPSYALSMSDNKSCNFRPEAAIATLMDCIRNEVEPFVLSKRRFIEYPRNEIWLVEDGMVSFYRNNGKQLIFISTAPFLMGVNNIFYPPGENYSVEPLGVNSVSRISIEKFTTLIENNGLWKDVATLMASYFTSSLINSFGLVRRSDYDSIKIFIYEYLLFSDVVKKNLTLAQYITEKGLISRSNTMRILSFLNKYRYITIHNGRLIHVHYLPDEI